VYDAPAGYNASTGAPVYLEEGRKNRRSGMGMFKTKGRIPWVVYILTTAQVIVFIVEIVKNGTYSTFGRKAKC
jgi:uncharacterized membrane protein